MDKRVIALFTDDNCDVEARGLAAAFALVAYADADLDPLEVLCFEDLIHRDAVLSNFENDFMLESFQKFCNRLANDYLHGKMDALNAVAEAALKPGVKVALVRMVQMATIADYRLAEQEEVMLTEIAAAAGVPPGKI